jgi:hypothetical protein
MATPFGCLLAFLLASFSTYCQASPTCAFSLGLSSRIVSLTGCISSESVPAALRLLQEADELRIDSEGGDVAAALQLANEIRRRAISVRVGHLCASSCANYVLPAGLRTFVSDDATVLFHGDAQISLRVYLESERPSQAVVSALTSIAASEASFFSSTPRAQLIHEAQLVALSTARQKLEVVVDGRTLSCRGRGRQSWTPSVAELIRLGIVDRDSKNATMPQGGAESLENDPFATCVSR